MATPVRHSSHWWGYITTGGLHARLCRVSTRCYGFVYAENEEDPFREESSVFTAPTAAESVEKAKAAGRLFYTCRSLDNFKSWQRGEIPVEEDEMIPKRPVVAKRKEVTTMKVEKKVFIDGTDGAEFSDGQLFTKIAKAEAEIKKLQEIGTKPKKLQTRIEELQGYIKDVAEYIDNR